MDIQDRMIDVLRAAKARRDIQHHFASEDEDRERAYGDAVDRCLDDGLIDWKGWTLEITPEGLRRLEEEDE